MVLFHEMAAFSLVWATFSLGVVLDYGQADLHSLRVQVPSVEIAVFTARKDHVLSGFLVLNKFSINLQVIVGMTLIRF